jgi:predicted esterase
MSLFPRSLFLILLVALTSCRSTGNLPEGVTPEGAAWHYGWIMLPGSALSPSSEAAFEAFPVTETKSIAVRPDLRLPAVIFLHGSFGGGGEGWKYMKLFTDLGYGFVQLDSTKHPDWIMSDQISSSQWRGHLARRRAEVSFTLKRLQEFPWVNKERLVLMGHSQGGHVVSSWSRGGFAGLIITGSNCFWESVQVADSPRAPREIPVLAIKGEIDNYFPGAGCKVSRQGPGSRSIIVPRAPHAISSFPQTREAIKKFLETCCKE